MKKLAIALTFAIAASSAHAFDFETREDTLNKITQNCNNDTACINAEMNAAEKIFVIKTTTGIDNDKLRGCLVGFMMTGNKDSGKIMRFLSGCLK